MLGENFSCSPASRQHSLLFAIIILTCHACVCVQVSVRMYVCVCECVCMFMFERVPASLPGIFTNSVAYFSACVAVVC